MLMFCLEDWGQPGSPAPPFVCATETSCSVCDAVLLWYGESLHGQSFVFVAKLLLGLGDALFELLLNSVEPIGQPTTHVLTIVKHIKNANKRIRDSKK